MMSQISKTFREKVVVVARGLGLTSAAAATEGEKKEIIRDFQGEKFSGKREIQARKAQEGTGARVSVSVVVLELLASFN